MKLWKKLKIPLTKKNKEFFLNEGSNRSVMLVSYGGSHMKIISCLSDILAEAGIKYAIIAPPGSQEYLKERHSEVYTFSKITDFPRIPREYSVLFAKMMEGTPEKLYRDSFYYLGNSLLDTAELIKSGEFFTYFPATPEQNLEDGPGLAEFMHQLFLSSRRQFLLPVNTMKSVLKKVSPGLVITTNSPRAERAVQIGAADYGIPCISLIDGYGTNEQYVLEHPGKILVPSSRARDNLIRAGVSRAKISVAGNPVLEGLLRKGPAKALACLDSMGINLKDWKKVFLFVQSPISFDPTTWAAVEQFIIRFAAERKDHLMIVKNHPGDAPPSRYISKNILLLEERIELPPFMILADCIIVSHSIAALEAAVLKRPVLVFSKGRESLLQGVGIEELVYLHDEAQIPELADRSILAGRGGRAILKRGFKSAFLSMVSDCLQ